MNESNVTSVNKLCPGFRFRSFLNYRFFEKICVPRKVVFFIFKKEVIFFSNENLGHDAHGIGMEDIFALPGRGQA